MKSALVTGSSGLIGRAIVDSFLASNYRVFGLDLVDREEFENQNFHFLKVDLADLGNIHQVVMDVSLKIDSLDCLVNNASCRPDGFFEPSHKYNLQTFEDVLKINLTSNLALSSELFNLLTKSESPSIINMSSIYGLRAFITKPKILVLDEATSSLDAETENFIADILELYKDERIVLSIAHRLSSIRNADRILFFDGGRLESTGTFEELKKNSAKFANQARLMGL